MTITAEVSVKKCTHCDQLLPLELFTKNISVLSGYGGHCRPCHNLKNRVRHENQKTEADYRASSLLRAAKERTSDVSITKDWVTERILKGVCEVTGIPFKMACEKPARPFTPSLDRKDPKRGYHPDNVQVVCWIYNRAKGVQDHESVMEMAKALVSINDN